MSAPGKKVSTQEVAIYRMVRGRIVEQWGLPDIQGLMEQVRAANPERKQVP